MRPGASAARTTTDDGYRARLLRVATNAINSEVDLLQGCGLLPHDLGTLRVEPKTERLPSGVDLAQRLLGVVVTEADLTSEAELAYRYGDAAAAEAAARDARDSRPGVPEPD
jgi:hypothetical protein